MLSGSGSAVDEKLQQGRACRTISAGSVSAAVWQRIISDVLPSRKAGIDVPAEIRQAVFPTGAADRSAARGLAPAEGPRE